MWHLHVHVFPRHDDDRLYEQHRENRWAPPEEREPYADRLAAALGPAPHLRLRQDRAMDFQQMQDAGPRDPRAYADVEASTYGRSWTTEEIMLGFLGDVGDLAKLVQGKAGVRPARGPRRGARPRARRLPVERADARRRLRRRPAGCLHLTMDELEGILSED